MKEAKAYFAIFTFVLFW